MLELGRDMNQVSTNKNKRHLVSILPKKDGKRKYVKIKVYKNFSFFLHFDHSEWREHFVTIQENPFFADVTNTSDDCPEAATLFLCPSFIICLHLLVFLLCAWKLSWLFCPFVLSLAGQVMEFCSRNVFPILFWNK